MKELLPHYLESSHPYNCKMQGNSMTTYQLPHHQMSLNTFEDDILILILSFLDATSLLHITATSRNLYVYGNYTDLWRDLTLSYCNINQIEINFTKCWRDSYAYAMKRHYIPHSPIKISGVYSNTIYRAWACCNYDIKLSFPRFYTYNNVSVIDVNNISYDEFVQQYERRNIPVVMKNATTHWKAIHEWTDEYLSEICGDKKFRATSAMASSISSFTMQQYLHYKSQCKEEVPLYLFERDFASHPILKNDFSIPDFFDSEKHPYMDLFRLFGEQARPDYRWLIMGPAKSGSIFHIDPNTTNAWNVVIRGKKKWIFYPPHVSPPGVISSVDGADVTVPFSIGEWLLAFWPYHLRARSDPDVSRRPLEIIAGPGDLVFVPHNWWHMVINLEDSIAITQNYVSDSNLYDVLSFLKNKPDQISGVRDRSGEAIQPEEMLQTFLDRLQVNFPTLYEENYKLLQQEQCHVVNVEPSQVGKIFNRKTDARSFGLLNATRSTTLNDSISTNGSFSFSFVV